MASEVSGVTTGQPNLHKQDLKKLDVSKLTALSPEVISRQATINIGTIGHVAHGKSTVVKAISGVQTVRFKNELERNITIKLERLKFDVNGRVELPQELTSQGIKCTARIVKQRRRKRKRPLVHLKKRYMSFEDYLEKRTSPTDADKYKRKRKRDSSENDSDYVNKMARVEYSPWKEQRAINELPSLHNLKILASKETQTEEIKDLKLFKVEKIDTDEGMFNTDPMQSMLRSRRKLSKQNNDYCFTEEDESTHENEENRNPESALRARRISLQRKTVGVLAEIQFPVETAQSRPRRSCSEKVINYLASKVVGTPEPERVPVERSPTPRPVIIKESVAPDDSSVTLFEELPCIDTQVLQNKLHMNIGSTAQKLWNNIGNHEEYHITSNTKLTQEFNGTELRIIKTFTSRTNHKVRSCKVESKGPRTKLCYEVEAIVGVRLTFTSEEYLVKWVGFSPKSNTWEPYAHLENSAEALSNFYALVLKYIAWDALKVKFGLNPDIPNSTLAQLLPPGGFAKLESNKLLLQRQLLFYYAKQPKSTHVKTLHRAISASLHHELLLRREKQLRVIAAWEKMINEKRGNNAFVAVQNNVDLTEPPADFIYVNDYVMSENVRVDLSAPPGCDCEECPQVRACCARRENNLFAYSRARRVKLPQGFPIYECNVSCKCAKTCRNRVVQNGCQAQLAIFRTSNECGWGVKTLQNIRKGDFVAQYVGEVITHDEAEARGQVYDSVGMTYLFDLDFDSPDNLYTVDAAIYGNVSHFINHSCDPNIGVWAVWIDCVDRNLPTLALFALRDIKKNEELTFDYMCDNGGGNKRSPVTSPKNKELAPNKAQCRCNADNCRRYLF